ncbi:hypothetical protein ACOMHN_026593 [Nucella lapillus]
MAEEFIWKVQNDEFESVKSMIEEDAGIINVKVNGRLPIHVAADYGHKDIIKLLLDKGAKINEGDRYGITPLLAAIYEGHTACVALLLKEGAKKNLKTPEGISYKDCAESDEIKQLLK